MYAIMGISGRVGSVVAQTILDAGQQVRAIVRSAAKATRWHDLGCDVAIADVEDQDSLERAFSDTQGAFVMLPPAYDQSPGLAEGHARANSIRNALLRACPAKVLALSTYGAQVNRPNLFNELGYLERVLKELDAPVTVLRAAWYMENHEWDISSANEQGLIRSHLQPLDKSIPMVSTNDVGRMAAQLLMEDWSGYRIEEFEGPEAVSPNRLAQAFASGLGKDVSAEAIPRNAWESGFKKAGINNPEPWIQSLEGTNDGWLAFEKSEESRYHGKITIDEAIALLLLSNRYGPCRSS
ncbi:NmrA family NAD(P)-binding protein [Xanthomonas euvesicatoria]|uniref:NmrA family NAD(P)-binding protein n=1 Tax=Xanthomonas euvesicatoria TaxID=456327 RepID=UPI001C4433EC|nr:NmrA family NAD(P)-binding protein [Xanthomonas euvesicatoria]MBV6804051.1 NmrA family NAD(P)-binding protein [Xanthomonas campestris pv. lawsoniae]